MSRRPSVRAPPGLLEVGAPGDPEDLRARGEAHRNGHRRRPLASDGLEPRGRRRAPGAQGQASLRFPGFAFASTKGDGPSPFMSDGDELMQVMRRRELPLYLDIRWVLVLVTILCC